MILWGNIKNIAYQISFWAFMNIMKISPNTFEANRRRKIKKRRPEQSGFLIFEKFIPGIYSSTLQKKFLRADKKGNKIIQRIKIPNKYRTDEWYKD